jgi:hypothetical protein
MRQSNFYLLIFSFILLNFTLSQRSLAYNTRNIRIGIIQHFGENNNQTLSVKAKSGQKNLQVIVNLRDNLNVLADKIQPKVYEYGFLLE